MSDAHAQPPSAPAPAPAHAQPQQALRALLATVAREQGYEPADLRVTHISTGGGNYTSELYLIRISAPNKEDLLLFAKEANIKGKVREDVPITKFYETERFVYGTLVDVYARLEEKNEVPAEHRLYFPKYYGCNPRLFEETIVLEDLAARGFRTHDRFASVDWPYARAAVAELAKLHALSFAFAADDPQGFARVLEQRKFEFNSDDDRMKAAWGKMVQGVIAATREEHRERLGRFMAENTKKMRDYYQPLRRPVLTHGDFRPSNLMHRLTDEGRLQVVPVDYQTLRAGCAATDLLYLVVTGSDAAFRARHYPALAEEYYAQLCAALRRLRLDPDAVYPREDFDYELKESLPFGLTVAVFVLPMVTVEAADAPNLDEMGIDNWHVKTSQLFAERLNGIVDDYVRWGVI